MQRVVNEARRSEVAVVTELCSCLDANRIEKRVARLLAIFETWSLFTDHPCIELKMAPLNIIVTGASGLLGRAVTTECNKRGHNGETASLLLWLTRKHFNNNHAQSTALPSLAAALI